MIFNLLRQLMKDEEFEKTRIELAETRAVLKEYKDYLTKEKESEKAEQEKVDPDFLVMLWAAVGLALTLAGEAANKLPKSEGGMPISALAFDQKIWLILALIAFIFLVVNAQFAMELTLQYARKKSNGGYKVFAYTLIGGLVLFVIGAVLMAVF